jgi:hypothetical protein
MIRFQDSKIPGFQDSKIPDSMFYSLPIAVCVLMKTITQNIIYRKLMYAKDSEVENLTQRTQS